MTTPLAPDRPAARLYFVDHLRVGLVILVVLHHLAVIYGANAPFYYVEPPATSDSPAYLTLLVFVLVNQAYFMGFFFLISGYFTPGSFDRKGAARFVKERLLRLGIPLVVFMLVLSPISFVGVYQMPSAWTGITTPFTWQQYPNLIGVGPLWFVEMLLIFDICYVAWRAVRRKGMRCPDTNVEPPGYGSIAAFVVALALVSYLLRVAIPLGASLLGFPTLAYLPQYVSFFALGVIAGRRDWLRTIPRSMGRVGLAVAIGATILLFPVALSGKSHFLGRGHWESAVYALWDSTFAVGMCLGLITHFRDLFNRTSRSRQFLSQHAFTVYIIHVPIIVLVALALRGVYPEQLLKFALAAIVGVPLCFAVAYVFRKLPLASRIL